MRKLLTCTLFILFGILLICKPEAQALSVLDWQYYSYGGVYTYPGGSTSGTFAADGTLGGTFDAGGPYFDMYATSNQLIIDYVSTRGPWSGSINSYNSGGLTIDNGILFTETIDTITSLTLNAATNMSGFSLANVTWDASRIAIDWEGLSFSTDTMVVLDIDGGPGGAPVPEPSTIILLGSGLLGLAWYGRKRKAA